MNMKFSVCLLTSASILLAMSACKTQKVVNTTPVVGVVKTQTVEQTEGTIQKILYGEWTASQIGDQHVKREPPIYSIR